jgi:hypothetical protein
VGGRWHRAGQATRRSAGAVDPQAVATLAAV